MSAPATIPQLSQLHVLEAEAVHIMREVAAQLERPVLLFSGGKDAVVALPAAPAEVRREARERLEQRQQNDDQHQEEQHGAGRRGLPLVAPEAGLRTVARVAALRRLADPVVVVAGHQSIT